jgi:molybdopterin-guanine dinucleotide biosynthesis protein A
MGKPKAWLPIAGEAMLSRVVRRLSQAVSPVVVVAAPGQDLPPLPADVMIARDEESGRGPLQGLASGLAALEGRAEAAFVTGCDVPFLRPAFVRRMTELLGSAQICVPRFAEHFQPLSAVYRADVLPIVRQLLAESNRGPIELLRRAETRVVEVAELLEVDPALESLRNVNTLEAYEQAVRDASA